jgi:hypothetical protein
VVFEAKVLSDVSTGVRYDAARNQIARTIDVLLDEHPRLAWSLKTRRPERTCFALVTPELFRTHHTSRLYGWLMNQYRKDPALLAEHLPHERMSTGPL